MAVLPDEQPQTREEGHLMSNLIEDIRELQAAASVLCAQCLRDEIAVRTEALDGLTVRLDEATVTRDSAPDGDERYLEVFGETIATVLVLAIFTAELTKRPADNWVTHVSPN
jgi:hypothetical protein